jgi:hypothetical protein
VSAEQLHAYLAALTSSLTVGVAIPLLILALLVFAVWRLLVKAQADANFDIAEILRDDVTQKVSMTQVLKLGSFLATTFILVVVVFALPNLLIESYLSYLGVWSATAGGLEFIKRRYPNPPGA